MDIAGKKILFIGIGFYDYEQTIKQILEAHGADVYYLSSAVLTYLARALGRFGAKKTASKINDSIRIKRLSKARKNNDIVFVIKGEQLTSENFKQLKSDNPNAEFKLYLWDSLIRHDNLPLLFENFKKNWSFDRLDCQNDTRLIFRPLFYRELSEKRDKIYALSFIGWLHSDRLAIVRRLRDELHKQGKQYYLKLYTAPFSYFIERYVKRSLTKDDRELITLKTIPYSEFQRVTAASEMVLDIAHPLQSGLTMRTIEALASGCHLLTTNADIANYDNISPQNYTLFNRDNGMTIQKEITNNSKGLGEEYSIESFIIKIFSE